MKTLHTRGRLSAMNARRVVWTAQALGLDVERTEASGALGLIKTPDYARLAPPPGCR